MTTCTAAAARKTTDGNSRNPNERIKPQKGIYYFISGGAAKLREGDVKRSELTEKSFDSGYHFMLVEIAKDALHFQVISDEGKTVDGGALTRLNDRDKKRLATSAEGRQM